MQRIFSVVINYFSTDQGINRLSASCLFSAALASEDPSVLEVLVVDGSPLPDSHLAAELQRLGCIYIHNGHQLTFAEGYNLGANRAQADWIVLCASDVYPSLTFFKDVQTLILKLPLERIGCIVPRLTFCDLSVQSSHLLPRGTYVLPLMTLNLNVFHREVFSAVGGVPNNYGGGFNDILMAMRLKTLGRDIFMISNRCAHYGQLTISVGGSQYRYEKDHDAFMMEHPHMRDAGSIWDLRVSSLTGSSLARALWSLSRLLGDGRIRRRVSSPLVTVTAFLQKVSRH